jgi:pyruvate,water dikinase
MYLLKPTDSLDLFHRIGGGKAAYLAELVQLGFNVPPFFCVTSEAFAVLHTPEFKEELRCALKDFSIVAVRSSGIGEDSLGASFAGIHSSFLFQEGFDAIFDSIQKCHQSCFSERAIEYRKQKGLPLDQIRTGVVIQTMIHAELSGVAFSRDPVSIKEGHRVSINATLGVGEGLVNGDVEGELFHVDRTSLKVTSPELPLSLSTSQAKEVAQLVMRLEEHYGHPQDFEFAIAEETLYSLQTRAITNLPSSAFYKNLDGAVLWDNSNIIESYSGVTTPLTFSFASSCYEEVYRQFCHVIAVPQKIINRYDAVFRNMLGLIHGRIYYNLVNWYQLAVLLPGATKNQEFMETMMGVKESLSFSVETPNTSLFSKLRLYATSIWRLYTIEKIVASFQSHFNDVYHEARKSDFRKLSLKEQLQVYLDLQQKILKRWQAPIINDCLCMIFFGLLKKFIGTKANDLLSGGDLESAEPTKMLLRIAKIIDAGDVTFRKWFLDTLPRTWDGPSYELFREFLERYGFRCVNELKLEEEDLHTNPSFAIEAIANFVRMKTFSLPEGGATPVLPEFKGMKKILFRFVLKQAKRAIRDREMMRFSRTKIFGVMRHLFRAMGANFVTLKLLQDEADIFYLTVDEIFAYVEGRGVALDLSMITKERRKEFDLFRNTKAPPDRLMTLGPAGMHTWFDCGVQQEGSDLKGTPCSPGIVEGVVRVVKELKDASGMNGEILVTEKTDPGWVPLYPSCSGLLIERGSLLSHSAVVARELGLPTIVGISGGLMEKLQTGMRVRMDGEQGTIEIL